jgi:hypothetical protein
VDFEQRPTEARSKANKKRFVTKRLKWKAGLASKFYFSKLSVY